MVAVGIHVADSIDAGPVCDYRSRNRFDGAEPTKESRYRSRHLHDFLALGAGIHVTMDTGEIAEFPDVYLQHGGAGMSKRDPMFSQGLGESVHSDGRDDRMPISCDSAE